MSSSRRVIGAAGVLVGALVLLPAGAAGADPAGAGRAGAFGATITVGGQEVVPPTPEAEVVAPPGGNASETLIDIPAQPLAVSGTLTANAAVHGPSDLPSTLTVNSQEVAGPYNARGSSLVEGLRVILDQPEPGVSLVSADAVRAEAVGVCAGGQVAYSANSEIIDLRVAGEQIPLNAPVEQIIDAIGDVLEQSGLNQVVDVQRNVVTRSTDGIAVDALVVTLLAAAGENPLAQVRIGHAEASGVRCGSMPECSDGADNDGDGAIDHPADPQCTSPQDNSEAPECSNGRDDDGDGRIDHPADPGCTDPQDDSEADGPATDDGTDTQGAGGNRGPATPTLARTGGADDVALAAALGLLGLGGLALRRRLSAA